MGMTITEKILARSSQKEKVIPGEVVESNIDIALAHDVTSAKAIELVDQEFGGKVWDPEKIIVTPDHGVPNKDIQVAELVRQLLDFVESKHIPNLYAVETGNYGVCHSILPDEGHVLPGEVIVGADSHTCTHGALGAFATGIGSTELGNVMATGKLWFRVPASIKIQAEGSFPKNVMAKDLFLRVVGDIGVDGALYCAMEWTGSAIQRLSMDERFTLTNMAIEAGAKSGIIACDDITRDYLKQRTSKPYTEYESDEDAVYKEVLHYDVSAFKPYVATPFSPANVQEASDLQHVKIHQAYIGSCTGGKIEDFEAAAQVLKGNKKAKGVRLLIVPATQKIQRYLVTTGLYDIFMDAGAVMLAPGCAACLGYHGGILAKGEVAISSTNRNFRGRMGHPDSKVYLASPMTVAASAISGCITPYFL